MSRGYGRGRYATGVYPTRSAAIPEMSTPFVATFQTINNDANPGDTATRSAVYWLTGKVLNVSGFYSFSGAGVTEGTGDFLLPFPPGYTAASIDARRMPVAEDIPPLKEGTIIVPALGVLGGTRTVFTSKFFLAEDFTDPNAPVVLASVWDIELPGLLAGDELYFQYSLPLF